MKTFIERLKICLYILTGKYENEVKELEEFITELKYSLEFYQQEVFELESYIDNVLRGASVCPGEGLCQDQGCPAHYATFDQPTDYLVEAMKKYEEGMEANGWISVKERLPLSHEEAKVIAWNGCAPRVADYLYGRFVSKSGEVMKDITHWRLPK